MAKPQKVKRTPLENPRSVRLSTNARVANVSNMELVQSVDDHVRWLKNRMSAHCHANLFSLLSNPVEFKQNYKNFPSRYLVAWEVQQIFHGVVDAYVEGLKSRLGHKTFHIQKRFVIETYKRNGKGFKKGDIRFCQVKLRPAKYSGLVKYLCYCPDLSLEALADTKIGETCQLIAREKPAHWRRIVGLVQLVQANLRRRTKLIEFTSGSYQRHFKESGSFVFRDESNTKYQWFYRYKTGKGADSKVVTLPLLINADKHDFSKLVLTGNHTVCLKRGKFHVILTQEGEKPNQQPRGGLVGGDLNCKSNLAVFSNGMEVRYDEAYLDRLIQELQQLDAKGNDKTREEKQRLGKLIRRNEWYWRHIVHDALDDLEREGVTDIVLENLRHFPATFLKHRDLLIKYSRLIRLLRLSDLKNWFRQQALKRGMRVHFVHPHYSSQRCRACGHIHRRNRKTQERFECKSCGHTANADFNASINLTERLTSDVLRDALHDLDEDGCLMPKKLNKFQIRRRLESVPPPGDFTVPLAPRVVLYRPLAV